MLARYGGEEFGCLLPETGLDGAFGVAQRMEQAVHALQLPHAASDVAAVVTVSVGVAVLVAGSRCETGALASMADEQLYLAKARGRAQACAKTLE